MSNDRRRAKGEEDLASPGTDLVQPAGLGVCVEICVAIAGGSPRARAGVIPGNPWRRWIEAVLDMEVCASIQQLPQQFGETDRCVATTLELHSTGHVFLGCCDVGTKGRRTGERHGAREAGLPEMTLHLDASRDSWRVRPYLDHHFPGIGQSQPKDRGEVPAFKDDVDRSGAEPLLAPPRDSLMSWTRHHHAPTIPRGRLACFDAAEEVGLREHRRLA